MFVNKRINMTINSVSLFVMALFFLRLFTTVHLLPSDDDYYFLHALDNKDITSFLYERYMTWSGRVPVEALMVKTIGVSLFWKIMIPASFLLLSFSIAGITNEKSKVPLMTRSVAVLLTICLIERSVIHDASIWISGFYNYLLPISIASISLLINKKGGILHSIFAGVLMAYSVANEQIAILFVFYSVYLIYSSIKNKGNFIQVLSYISIPLISSFVWLTSPGNTSRFNIERDNLIEFGRYDFLDKVSRGFASYANHVLSGNNILIPFSLIVFSLMSLSKREGVNKSEFTILSVTMLSISIMFIANLFFENNFTLNNSEHNNITIYDIGCISTYIKYFISMIIAMLFLYFSYLSRNLRYGIFCIVFGMSVVVMVGLSPAIYAERPRIFFISDMLLIAFVSRSVRV